MSFDLLGLCLRSGEPEQDVIGISHVAQSPIATIAGILAWETAQLLAQRPHHGTVAAAAGPSERVAHPLVLRISLPEHAPGVSRDEDCFDKLVQPVQVDVGQAPGREPRPAARR